MNYENFVSAISSLSKKYMSLNPGMYLHVNICHDSITITHGSREELRQEWVDLMLEEFNKSYADESEIILSDKKRKVLIAHFCDEWGDNIGYGIAKCSANDEFDENVGLAVAFAHFHGYPIPDFV